MYKLFIDDERFPPTDDFFVTRSYVETVELIKSYGLPSFISFDHDLGNEKTGFDIAKWIVNFCLDNDIQPTFSYYVHSQNPIGKNNIEGIINAFKKSKEISYE